MLQSCANAKQNRHGNKTGVNTQSLKDIGGVVQSECFPDIAINTITILLVCLMFMHTVNALS